MSSGPLCPERLVQPKEQSWGVLLNLCKLVGNEAKVCFMPTRRSNIPCNIKFDTECISQIFLPHSKCLTARRTSPSREVYNDWVWEKLLQRRVVTRN